MANQMLEVVDENGIVIDVQPRDIIHKHGLLHREVHIWFYTPDSSIIFQKRSPHKGTYPGLLDATVGGHVDQGMSFESTALKEIYEETGLNVDVTTLRFVTQIHINKVFDPVTQTTNNALRQIYAYCFEGDISLLQIEENEGVVFEPWPISTLLSLSEQQKKLFIPQVIDNQYLGIFKTLLRS